MNSSSSGRQSKSAPLLHRGEGRILLMDDEEIVLDITRSMLGEMGYQVSCARNSEQALSQYQQAADEKHPFDLVLLDLTISGGAGGLETAKELLSLNPQAKLIAISGHSNEPIMRTPAEFGFIASLHKPYVIEDLIQLLSRIGC